MQNLEQELNNILTELKQGWDKDSVQNQIEYLGQIAVLKARISELKVYAETMFLNKLEEFIRQNEGKEMKAFEYRDKRDVFLKNEEIMRGRIEKLGSVIDMQTKSLITVISFAKEEMRMTE